MSTKRGRPPTVLPSTSAQSGDTQRKKSTSRRGSDSSVGSRIGQYKKHTEKQKNNEQVEGAKQNRKNLLDGKRNLNLSTLSEASVESIKQIGNTVGDTLNKVKGWIFQNISRNAAMYQQQQKQKGDFQKFYEYMENIKKQNNEKITFLNSSQLNNEHVNLYNGYNIPFDQYQYAYPFHNYIPPYQNKHVTQAKNKTSNKNYEDEELEDSVFENESETDNENENNIETEIEKKNENENNHMINEVMPQNIKKWKNVFVKNAFINENNQLIINTTKEEYLNILKDDWPVQSFKTGIRLIEKQHKKGKYFAVVKGVRKRLTDDEIFDELRKEYNVTNVRRIINKNNETTTLVKIETEEESHHINILRHGVYINNWHHSTEEYIFQIKTCFKCLKPGHIAKNCKNENEVCSICGENGHYFKNCEHNGKKDKEVVKCANCGSNDHLGGSKKCSVYKRYVSKVANRNSTYADIVKKQAEDSGKEPRKKLPQTIETKPVIQCIKEIIETLKNEANVLEIVEKNLGTEIKRK
ncbi:unnamed protein product, partial [Brachionus calyciflorus]